MALITNTRTKPYVSTIWGSGTGSSICYPVLDRSYGTGNGIKSYQSVTSERRPKPRNARKPNFFKVHKYFADGGLTVPGTVCNTDNNHYISYDGALLQTSDIYCNPQDLCLLYKNVTENAKADVFAKANSPAVFDLAPVLAELAETVMWVGGICNGLKTLLLSLFSSNKMSDVLRAVRRGILEPESLWLEYRYAIMPFILTISDAIEAYKGGSSATVYDARVVREYKHRYKTSLYYAAYTNPNYGWFNDVVDTVSATARITVKSQCDPSPLGTGFWDVVRAGYEVLPLSFVLNWIVGIEEWLTSIRNTNLEVESSYVTTVVDRKAHVYSKTVSNYEWIDRLDWNYHEYMMVRQPDIEPPKLPLLQAELLSAYRTVDAISLVISFLKGILSHKK